ncbi:MAG: hypothetical protein ACLQVF_07690 [Isosphaeraceae bacterium]
MSFLDSNDARREVEHLHGLAIDFWEEGQYDSAERLLERAAEVAEQLGDLSLLARERFYLADTRRMKCNDFAAMATYTWLIGLASDPVQGRSLDEETLRFIVRGFAGFVECGAHQPGFPVGTLLRTVEDGLAWLDRVGKSHWAASLRLLRGGLQQERGEADAARRDTEAALALKRRHTDSPGYDLASFCLNLADLLCRDVNAPAQAVELAEEVLDRSTHPYDRCRAFSVLCLARIAMGDLSTAQEAARSSLEYALQMDSPFAMARAYDALSRVLIASGQIEAAVTSSAQLRRWSRRSGLDRLSADALVDCARLRLEQARRACGITGQQPTPSMAIHPGAKPDLAGRRLRSARRFLDRARPLARKLDTATGRSKRQDEVEGVGRLVEELFVSLEIAAISPSNSH